MIRSAAISRREQPNEWFVYFNPHATAQIRLFCFPYAGGDANVYRDWAHQMPEGIEIIGVQYPGRGMNRQRPIDDSATMVAALRSEIAPLLKTSFAFFGHSNGALISFELGRSLKGEERHRYLHHFLSAKAAPHVAGARRNISHLNDDELVAAIRRMGGTPEEVLRDRHLVQLILPRLRADFTLSERYVYQPGDNLTCPISLLRGEHDHLVNPALVKRWSELTSGSVDEREIAGDHFFLASHRAEVVDFVRSKLQPLLCRSNASFSAERRNS